MVKKKVKAYKFSILMSIICIVLTGVNYLVFKVPAVGVAFIVGIIVCIITIICYNIEKQNKRED
ncbi:hypothetical protein RBH29_01750 [Herbivorax sp. ANBcel31]|uniref:hypothetical protein n=1 Tax=Herbivorax sp. ANBcel31 TaxID=3069754 RepID=UPI0027B5A467|nr:hypothetical protein [Herbivorax sp. ANBcel31]MDQ2085159.1 hypothetical protein [Herbivorax sp. ANBcel31]